MNTTENNKLIAEFMGYIECPMGLYRMGDEFSFIEIFSEYQEEDEYLTIDAGSRRIKFSPNKMLFHSSWDWLMPVVSKITRQEKYIGLMYRENIMDTVPYGLIEDTYEYIVEFIKWYNKNKED